MKKRTQGDIVKKAIPEAFGNRKSEVKKNYVVFPVPEIVHKKIREWQKSGDDSFKVMICGRDEALRLLILNEKEQALYRLRGFKGN